MWNNTEKTNVLTNDVVHALGKLKGIYSEDPVVQVIDNVSIPNMQDVEEIIKDLTNIIYIYVINDINFPFTLSTIVKHLFLKMRDLALNVLCYHYGIFSGKASAYEDDANDISLKVLDFLPDFKQMVKLDIEAAYAGDPAAVSLDEIILSYPFTKAIIAHRLAHKLYKEQIPLLPRMISEWSHSKTGIDIHPGADIGSSFFIDHGTGVVIGETTEIGRNVKIYQGVTLGALSFKKDSHGNMIRGTKRHPTLKDNVIVYANAAILGGDTIIGKNSIIGGNAWITSSIEDNTVVTVKMVDLVYRKRKKLKMC